MISVEVALKPSDAYNSLSVKGYKVNAEPIERVRSGNLESGCDQRIVIIAMLSQLAATSRKVLKGRNASAVADDDHARTILPKHHGRYSETERPRVLSQRPPSSSVAPCTFDSRPAFFELLSQEKEPAVRVVLGHFMFVYIHPYFDGNGRISRFFMNVVMVSDGYPWTVIPLERRAACMAPLELE